MRFSPHLPGIDDQFGLRCGIRAELADRAESLSPIALLRPVIQDSMLPTVAYLGGPAEIVNLLLAAGADPTVRTKGGQSAADWARQRGMLGSSPRRTKRLLALVSLRCG